jgi:alanine-synthesizing transaminase
VIDLLRSKKILVTHGTGFNWPDPNDFRLVTLPTVVELEDAIGRIASFLEDPARRLRPGPGGPRAAGALRRCSGTAVTHALTSSVTGLTPG